MVNRQIFSKRLKILRESHRISASMLANLLNFKSKGSVGNLESGNSIPLSDSLTDIASLFAVSLDWLIGHSKTSYQDDLLVYFETQHISRILASENTAIHDFSLAYIKENRTYLDPEKRKDYFSLPLRANIIFILNRLKFETDKFAALDQPLQTIWYNFEDFKKHALPPLLDGYQFYKLAKRDNVQQLHDLFTLFEKIIITNEIKSPVFDIQKLSATHKKNG